MNKYNEIIKQKIILEKALELACEKLPMEREYCSDQVDVCNLQNEYGSDEPYYVYEHSCEDPESEDCLKCVENYFKNKAKEFYGSYLDEYVSNYNKLLDNTEYEKRKHIPYPGMENKSSE